MNRIALALGISVAFVGSACAVSDGSTDGNISSEQAAATGELGMHGAPEHVQLQKGAHKGGGGGGGSPLMTYHGGTILSSTLNKTQAIFWGTSWATYSGDKITGLDSFFAGFGGSNYAKTSTEYTGTNGQETANSSPLPHAIDTSAAPNSALSTSSAVAEGCKVTGNNPDPEALYLIYTDTGAGHVSYCAWHSYGTCSNGKPIQVAYMPNLDGVTGCDPGDTTTGHSPGLAALANVTAHELSETMTDPRNGGWYDGSGQENGDKCAWTFNVPSVTFTNGSSWKLQGEWSNNAYNSPTLGYPNSSGQKGCLDGH